MNIVGIEAYREFPIKNGLIPRERYVTYYNDLAKTYGTYLNYDSLLSGGQRRAIDLLLPIMKNLRCSIDFSAIDFLMLLAWAPDFDPDIAALGPYIVEHYCKNAYLCSITDQGLLSFFTALNIIKAFLGHGIKQSLLLAFEQTTLAHIQGYKSFNLEQDGAAGLILENDLTSNQKVLESFISDEKLSDIERRLCNKYSITQSNVVIHQIDETGILPVFMKINNLVPLDKNDSFNLIQVKDVETEYYGYILLG